MNKNLIRVYGDSLSMPRAAFEIHYTDTYAELLKKELEEYYQEHFILYQRSAANQTIVTAYDLIHSDNYFFGEENENCIMILHVGICDLAPRPIPLFLRNIVSKLPNKLRKNIVSFLHNNRSRMQKFKYYQYISLNTFKEYYEKVLNETQKYFKYIICINVMPTLNETEEHSPGLKQSIEDYNLVIKTVIESKNYDNVYLIDLNSKIKSLCKCDEDKRQYLLEDGEHITKKTHQLCKDEILNIIKSKI